MNIRNLVLVGIVVIAGGAAFVYFDPLDLDLLGQKKSHTVAQPVATPKVAAAPKPPAAPANVPAPTPAPASPTQVCIGAGCAIPSPTPAAPAASPPAAPVAVPPPAATPVAAKPVVAPPAQTTQPPLKLAKTISTEKQPTQPGQPGSKATGKPERAKNLDLRHCLELETDKAIAKCAGE